VTDFFEFLFFDNPSDIADAMPPPLAQGRQELACAIGVERFFTFVQNDRVFVGADAHISPRERQAAPLRIDCERMVVGAGFHARPREARWVTVL